MRVCSIEACGKSVIGRGLCSTHYSRWRIHGDATVVKPRNTKVRGSCSTAGCQRPHHARGLCETHYWRQRVHGAPGDADIHRYRRRLCKLPGCIERVQARGWCQRHYNSWARRGHPLAVEREPIKPLDGPARYVPPEFERELVRPSMEFMADIQHRLDTIDPTLGPAARRALVLELTDELIRASCGTAHLGKADVLTRYKQQRIDAHERTRDPASLARWAAA
jgi:hypothetical protein